MNIEQYRAIKEAEKNTEPNTATVEPSITEPKTADPQQTALPDKILIENVGEVDVNELKKGYLRQSDYTKKTQELASQRREAEQAIKIVEQLRQRPDVADVLIKNMPGLAPLNPIVSKANNNEARLYDLMLERDIALMEKKYSDFEAMDVLNVAQEKNLMNLEDAYLMLKGKTGGDVKGAELESRIRDSVLKELGIEKPSLQTTISSGGNSITASTDKLNPDEVSVASGLGMSPDEYTKWKNMR